MGNTKNKETWQDCASPSASHAVSLPPSLITHHTFLFPDRFLNSLARYKLGGGNIRNKIMEDSLLNKMCDFFAFAICQDQVNGSITSLLKTCYSAI